MAGTVRILRPLHGQLTVKFPDVRTGRKEAMREAFGVRAQIEYDGIRHVWHLSATHLFAVCRWASTDYRVEVTLEGNATTKCVVECWTANPGTVGTCVCSCAGSNHGSGSPLPVDVDGRLSVQHDRTSARYLYEDGRLHLLD